MSARSGAEKRWVWKRLLSCAKKDRKIQKDRRIRGGQGTDGMDSTEHRALLLLLQIDFALHFLVSRLALEAD
jgi:hypothetical protein